MRKLLIAAGLCALFATPGLAGEPTKLSLTEMDKVTSAGFCKFCSNFAEVKQVNVNFSKKSKVKQTNNAAVFQSIN